MKRQVKRMKRKKKNPKYKRIQKGKETMIGKEPGKDREEKVEKRREEKEGERKREKEKMRCGSQDGGEIGGSRVHFPSTPVKHLADLRSSQQYSSIYEDRRPKIEDIERSDGKKSA